MESLWSLLVWCFVSIFRTTSYLIAQEFFLKYAYIDVCVSKRQCSNIVFCKSLLEIDTLINWTLWYLPFQEFRKTFKESSMVFANCTIKNLNQILNVYLKDPVLARMHCILYSIGKQQKPHISGCKCFLRKYKKQKFCF